MKTRNSILMILVLLLFSMCGRTALNRKAPSKHKLMYLVMIGSDNEAKQAEKLVKSIREFGGSFSEEPVIIVTSGSIDLDELAREVQVVVPLDMDSSLMKFPFADKVYACAQVERMVRDSTDWLMWLNPDALMFAPPDSVLGDTDKWVSVRSVHIANVGSAFSKPLNEYWKTIYTETGVDTAILWPVNSLVDKISLRPYFNSGCMAFRPRQGILQSWKNAFCSMLGKKELHEYYSADNNRAVFFHQAVLSAVIISKAGRDRINILPDDYSYPLILQDIEGFTGKIDSIPGLTIVLCGDYKKLGELRINEPWRSWIKINVPEAE